MANWPAFTAQEKHNKAKPGKPARYTWTVTTTAPCGHGLKVSAHAGASINAKKAAIDKIHVAIRDEARKCGGNT